MLIGAAVLKGVIACRGLIICAQSHGRRAKPPAIDANALTDVSRMSSMKVLPLFTGFEHADIARVCNQRAKIAVI